MAQPKFFRPKSLYIEATGVDADGEEYVVRMKLEPAEWDSELTLDMENLVEEDEAYLFRPEVRIKPTGQHNVKIEFTKCRAVDPEPAV